MDFIHDLQRFWQQKGFKRIKYEPRILWVREEPDKIALVEIIPEWLPGQPRVSVEDLEKEAGKIQRDLMIRSGRRVERLTLMLCSDLPDQQQITETLEYPDIWWLDSRHGRLFIFEKQRTDFLGLKEDLEEFAIKWREEERKRDRLEWQRMLQPVTVSLVLVNVLVFLLLSLTGSTEDAEFMLAHGAMSWESVMVNGQYYRLLTSMFLHFGADHLLQNMLILMLTGSRLERALGKVRYIIVYLGAGLIASFTSVFFTLKGSGDISAGASGAIFGVMGGLAALLLIDVVTKKRKYMQEIGLTGVIFMIVCSASYGFFSVGVDNAAHIGGLVGGFILTFFVTFFGNV